MKSQFPPVLSRGLSCLAISALLGTTVLAQAPATPSPLGVKPAPGAAPAATPAATPAKPMQMTDQTYLRNALKSLTYQIQLANAGKSLTDVGQARLRDDTVKDLTAALQALTKIAEAHGEKVAAEVTGNDKFDLDRVTKSKPDKLAKEWVDALAKESKRLDRETDAIGKTTQDADLKTFVTNYGPSIRSVFSSSDSAQKAMLKKK